MPSTRRRRVPVVADVSEEAEDDQLLAALIAADAPLAEGAGDAPGDAGDNGHLSASSDDEDEEGDADSGELGVGGDDPGNVPHAKKPSGRSRFDKRMYKMPIPAVLPESCKTTAEFMSNDNPLWGHLGLHEIAPLPHVLVPGQKLAIWTSPDGAKSVGTVDDASPARLLQVGWKLDAETNNLESLVLTPANASATSASLPPRSEPDPPGVILRALSRLGLKSAAHVMKAWERGFTCPDGRVSLPIRQYTKAARDEAWNALEKKDQERLSTAFGELCAAYYASVRLTPTLSNPQPQPVCVVGGDDAAQVTCDSSFTQLAKAGVVLLGNDGIDAGARFARVAAHANQQAMSSAA